MIEAPAATKHGQGRGADQHRVAEPLWDGVRQHLAHVDADPAAHVGDPRHPQGEGGSGDEVAGEEVRVGEDGGVAGGEVVVKARVIR